MKFIDWSNGFKLSKSDSKKSDAATIVRIRTNLARSLEAHHAGDTKSVIDYHSKIDNALHDLVGERGLRSEEK